MVLNDTSPQKLISYEKQNPNVLIGILNKGIQTNYIEIANNLIYHTIKVKPAKLKDEDSGYVKIKTDIKYFAPYFSGKGVKEYYEIVDYRIIPRKVVFPSGLILDKPYDTSDRLIITIGKNT